MNRYRGILIRWNKKAETYIAMLHLACGIITWKATGLLGWALSIFSPVIVKIDIYLSF
jgi:hypothetical protein